MLYIICLLELWEKNEVYFVLVILVQNYSINFTIKILVKIVRSYFSLNINLYLYLKLKYIMII
jgi:hypothetical protein